MNKKYINELFTTCIITLSLLITNNPIGTTCLWSVFLIIYYKKNHGFFNSAITLSLYMKNYYTTADMLLLVINQAIGSSLALIIFKFISGSFFTPDQIPLETMPFLIGIESICTFILCNVILTMKNIDAQDNTKKNIIHTVFIYTLGHIATQSLGGILNPSFGAAVLIITAFFNRSAETNLLNSAYYSMLYCITPLLLGLLTPYLKNIAETENE